MFFDNVFFFSWSQHGDPLLVFKVLLVPVIPLRPEYGCKLVYVTAWDPAAHLVWISRTYLY